MSHFKLSPLALSLLALSSVPVLADETAAPEAPTPAASEGGSVAQELGEVVIRAQADAYKADTATNSKFTAPLLDTPKSVQAITKEILEETNARSLQEALRTVPGITFGQGEGGTPTGDRPFIRGFDAQTSVYIDGLRDPGSQSRDVFNIEQVDVTKGSDSTFGGSGSTGGSLNMATKQAKLGNSGGLDVGVGNADYRRVTADLNQQINETTAVRVNALREHSGVAGRDAVFDDRSGGALSFNTGLGTDTVVGFDLYTFSSNGLPDYGIPFKTLATTATMGSVNQGLGYISPTTAARETVINVNRNNFYGLKDRDFRQTGQDSSTLRLEHHFDESLTVRNRTRFTQSYNRYVVTNPGDSRGWFNADPTPNDLTDQPSTGAGATTLNNASGQWLFRSQKNRHVETDAWINQTEATGQSELAGLKNSYTVGLELSSSDLDSRGYTVTGNSYANIANPNPNDVWNGILGRATAGTRTKTDVQALYALDTLTLNEQWLLNLGLRFDRFETHQTGYVTPGATAAQIAAVPGQDIKSDANILSYQLGLVFKPASNGSIYLSYATSASPSGFASGDSTESAVALTNKDLDPEETLSLELGTKWDLLNQRLSLTAAIFDMKKSNAKVTNNLGATVTAGEQAIKGAELGVTGAITPEWNISAGYTYLDSELVDGGFTNTGCSGGTAASTATGTTCTAGGGTLVYTISTSNGKEFANTPKNSYTLWTTYTVMPGLSVGGGASYTDKVYSDAANLVWLPSYTRYDAMASYQLNKNTSLRLNVNNLTNETYYEKPQNPHMAFVAPGRQVLLTASYKF